MAEYTVTLTGLSAGADMDKAAVQFAKAFKVDEAKARALIDGGKRIGSGVSRERAEKYLDVLGRIGVEASVAPPLEPELVVGDEDVDESAQTIIQLPGQGLAPVADPDAGPEEVDDGVDQSAATIMMAAPIADPDAPQVNPDPAEADVNPNAATVIAAVPVADPDAADAGEDIDPNAATVIAAVPVRDPDAPPAPPAAVAEPAARTEPEPEAEAEPERKGLLARLLSIFGR